jgi:C4-dicarboxylate transporter, DctM subunit
LTNLETGFVGIAAALVLIALRVPIALALGSVSFVGITYMRGYEAGAGTLRTALFDFSAHWSLSAVPMFLLMGSVAHYSGVSTDLFRAARAIAGRLPGGLAVASNFACAGFSAASGSSLATAAAMGRITIPEMLKAGYDKSLAAGVVASAGTLGAMIPPSILMVIYAVFAEVSISKLFIAGIIPGILTALIYAAMIMIRCWLKPELAPKITETTTYGEKLDALVGVWPLLALILGILGGLYAGIFTATEAGAVGAFLSIVIAVVRGRMTMNVFTESVMEAVITTARILFVALGAVLLTRFVALSGISVFLTDVVGAWAVEPIILLLLSSLIFVLLGMFLDPLGLMLLTLPVLMPLFESMGLDLIWFGILVIKFVEIGLLTPPIGLNVYVVKSVAGDSMPLEAAFRGVAWFLVCEIFIVGLLIGFPSITLYLPSLM